MNQHVDLVKLELELREADYLPLLSELSMNNLCLIKACIKFNSKTIIFLSPVFSDLFQNDLPDLHLTTRKEF